MDKAARIRALQKGRTCSEDEAEIQEILLDTHGAELTVLKNELDCGEDPHDRLFKKAFRQVEHARSELRAVLPPGVLADLDLARLEVKPTSFIDPELSELFSDLIYAVPLHGTSAFVGPCWSISRRTTTEWPFASFSTWSAYGPISWMTRVEARFLGSSRS